MASFESNSDIVGMTAYAPLFSKIGSTQWVPDLIWFTNTESYGTPSYHVQQLFGANRPDVLLPTEVKATARLPAPAGRIGLQNPRNRESPFGNGTGNGDRFRLRQENQ